MEKIKLNIEELNIESFETTELTARAADPYSVFPICSTDEQGCRTVLEVTCEPNITCDDLAPCNE